MNELDQLRTELGEEILERFPGLDASEHRNITHVASLSDYFTLIMRRDPGMLRELIASGDLHNTYDAGDLAPGDTPVDQLDEKLREIRSREMVRIIYRDLLRLADLPETTRDLSNLADAMIEAALRAHYENHCDRYGTPIGAESREQVHMSVLALGKLGAGELNLSSDIDLVFFFGEEGCVGGHPEISNSEFFVRTARALIASLDKVTEKGFVFRVDMRLRPYGDSGGLILTRAAMEKYYVEQGREWERYAFIKARACAGDISQGESFLQWLTPFVYRRHLDFGAIDSLREMKRLINFEVDLKELGSDLKLGHGGIREVEFVAQAYQLVYGGNDPLLQERSLLQVLGLLQERGLMETGFADGLKEAYCFLRNSEHVIQAEADQQTQALPTNELSKLRLAIAMGFEDYGSYEAALDGHRAFVRERFSAFMSVNRSGQETGVEEHRQWIAVWEAPGSAASIEILAARCGEAEVIAGQLVAFSEGLRRKEIQEIGVDRVDRLLPLVLSLVVREDDAALTLERLLRIVDGIARRSTYLAFLLENFDALKRMVQLCAMSDWVAARLAEMPILLYELSDRVTEDQAFDRNRLTEEMRQLIQNLDPHDLEAQMDSLRQFKNAAVLKVAVFQLLGLMPVMKASDALTDIAEIVISRSFELAWSYLTERHGVPCDADGVEIDPAFAVIAYGKLGGIELGFGSDLDLVFLHDADARGRTNGERVIDSVTFYIRLGQRMVHVMSSMTRFGTLFDIDLRLRPQGNSGPIVASFAAFERYLNEAAWTWEHQALVRARYVAGSMLLKSRFDEIRQKVLRQERDRQQLLDDVVSMREKMRSHFDGSGGSLDGSLSEGVMLSGFDLKQGAGAIVDIEFMVQFAVLADSHSHPGLTQWTDKIRILDDLRDEQLFTEAEVSLLQRAYIAYRTAVHYRALGFAGFSMDELNRLRSDVVEVWNRHMSGPGA